VLKGNLRQRFYADVANFGAAPDAARQVAAGYICLALVVIWIVSTVATALAYQAITITTFISLFNAGISYVAFSRIARRRDPRRVIDWLVLLYCGSAMIAQYIHSTFVAPMVMTLPVMAAIAVLYQRPQMRPVSGVAGTITVGVCLLAALGVIGTLPSQSASARVVMVFAGLLATVVTLFCVAVMEILAREYVHDQLRQTNNAFGDSASRASTALESARVGLWDAPDAAHPRFLVTDSFRAITGYTSDEFNAIFVDLKKFIHADDVSVLRDAFAVGQERMSRIRVDFRMLNKTRGYRWFSARARYIPNPDGTTRISGSLQDINVVKAAEEALRTSRDQARAANKAKSDFIGVMSHEVRTPLNAILGSVEVLKRGRHDNETAELIGLIDDAGRGLLAIANDLLDVTRIDAGRMEIAREPLDITTALTRTVEFWGAQAREKGLDLTVDCTQAEGLPMLMLDAGRVRQIVGNLLSNAIKFTDTGSVVARISAHEGEEGRIDVVISVIDTGPGVPGDVAEAIFSAFEQAPGAASRGGAGLGLFISRRLARMMGGDLTLEPARAKGAHFRLTLSADRVDPELLKTATPDIDDAQWQGLRILCVDDNDKNRRIAALLLGKLGLDVTLCASGEEALDLCATQPFDVILMDIIMPEMDGLETLRRLRIESDSLNRATPAVALTAKIAPEDIASYLQAGFASVSAKPINVADLASAIARVLVERPRVDA
jgi:signal transduction histidine kinase/ActR/RegA family two-component response regulator